MYCPVDKADEDQKRGNGDSISDVGLEETVEEFSGTKGDDEGNLGVREPSENREIDIKSRNGTRDL